jgi:hypothetical protein
MTFTELAVVSSGPLAPRVLPHLRHDGVLGHSGHEIILVPLPSAVGRTIDRAAGDWQYW